ncbi:hypothetical protein SMSP2_00910 [Limihaloglobus sulfuriphilus]|uniref:Transglutaminase-like domain-containing protein n=1 Tax=Limihaloglobus sulfuriphilus TaxID=1851148 RepID=A0A1Q2MDD2_9BACT|nr:hypothetical protein [Limihaloglobus sulfuriphilus]AQQ70558.1 hypothetical protein SMSP2_00910 [Limihaloglobus sulfuriphilus]
MIFNIKNWTVTIVSTLLFCNNFAAAEEKLSFSRYHQVYGPVYSIGIKDLSFDNKSSKAEILLFCTEKYRFFYQGKEIQLNNGILSIPFEIADSETIIKQTIDVFCAKQQFFIELEYFSPKYFQKVGKDYYKDGYLILNTDLPRLSTPKTYLDLNYKNELLDLLQPYDSKAPLNEHFLNIVKKQIDILHQAPKHKGPPIGTFKDGYLFLKAAIDSTHSFSCSGNSLMIRDCLRAVGIPARNVAMVCSKKVSNNNLVILESQGHTTNEAFINGKWQWFDAYFNYLYAKDKKGGNFLNTWELIDHLANPLKRDRLLFGVYDPEKKLYSELTLDESVSLRSTINRYFTTDKDLIFR